MPRMNAHQITWTGLLLLVVATIVTADNGTSKGLKEIVLGRCWDYKDTKYQGILPSVETDCKKIWRDFRTAFACKGPCNVTLADYRMFVKDTKQEMPVDKSMFWSGTYGLTHQFSEQGKKFITLEDTMLGFIANELSWCGQTVSPGINYETCPHWNDCPLVASESFWGAASEMFAKSARGNVTIMLDGSNPSRPAYKKGFFSTYELPNLDIKKVDTVNVLLAHRLDQPHSETCQNGSLLQLEKDVLKHGLKYTCEDDPEAVMFMLCMDDPDNHQCELVSRQLPKHIREMEQGTFFNSRPWSF